MAQWDKKIKLIYIGNWHKIEKGKYKNKWKTNVNKYKMTHIIVFAMVLIFGTITYLVFQFFKTKKSFENKVIYIEEELKEITKKIETQNQSLKLIEEINVVLKTSNQTLSNSIFNFNFEMLEEIYPKK